MDKETQILILKELYEICEYILYDATGDINIPDKRVWPIRANNYRNLRTILDKSQAGTREG